MSETIITDKKRSSVLTAGLALFSMFFGAGDLLWPLLLGGESGHQASWSIIGLLLTGVGLPLLGLISMLLFGGEWKAFFYRLGRGPGMVVLFLIQIILGPLGSIPRLFTLCHATLKPYLPAFCDLFVFSILASVLVFALSIKRRRIIDILGLILTPLLLLTLGAILYMGFKQLPPLPFSDLSSFQAVQKGAIVGYNTLDMIASFLFAPLVMSHFQTAEGSASKKGMRKMLLSSLIAAGLLSSMYIGLTTIAACYTPYLSLGDVKEQRLLWIAHHLLGSQGALLSAVAVALACLTTAIPLAVLFADYLRRDLLQEKIGPKVALILPLIASAFMANLGFMGIANVLSPILQILCPGLIVLCVLNICYKLFNIQTSNTPVFIASALAGAAQLL